MRQWLRHHHYALSSAVRRLARQPFSALANILVIALSLTLPLAAAMVLTSLQPVLGHVTVDPSITLFFAPASNTDLDQTGARLQAYSADAIAHLRIVPKAAAREQLAHEPGWAEALAALPDNPLPDAIVVTLKPQAAAQAETLAQAWRAWDGVEHVQLDSDWVRRLQSLLDILRMVLGLLAASVGLVVLASTFNTVRMQALSQREEIAVARLVGATEPFVRRPFLYLGAVSGTLAGVLAIGATAVALMPINAALHALAASYGASVVLALPPASTLLAALACVAALCALAARWSVTRATRL